MLVLALLACKPTEPAPADIDGLAHYVWQQYDEGTDEELALAVVNLDAALEAMSTQQLGGAQDYLSEHMSASISDLTKEEAEIVLPDDDRDPTLGVGLLVVNPLPCTVDQVERFTYALDQMEIFPDAYTAYDRQYTSDFDAYTARRTSFLTWHVELDAKTAGIDYHESLDGGIRYVPALDDEASPFGPVLVNRTWLVEPAVFQSNGDFHFDQDFQLEVQYERQPGVVVHYYVIWRQAEYLGLSQEGEFLTNQQIDGIIDWDEDFAALCAAETGG